MGSATLGLLVFGERVDRNHQSWALLATESRSLPWSLLHHSLQPCEVAVTGEGRMGPECPQSLTSTL